MMSIVVCAHIDKKIKDVDTALLAAIGLMVSDKFQLTMARISAESKPLAVSLVPNAETIAALKAARRGDLAPHDSVEDHMAALNVDE